MTKSALQEQTDMQNQIAQTRQQINEVSRHLQAALDAMPKVDGVEFACNDDIKSIKVKCGIENLAIALDLPVREVFIGGVRCIKVEDDETGLNFCEVDI